MKNIEVFLNDLLQNAARNNKVLLLKCLIKLGINVNSQHEYYGNDTALHTAAIHGSVEVLKLLLDNGADLTIKNSFNATILHYAILRGNLEIINLILQKGGDIKAQGEYDNAALHTIIPYAGISDDEVVRLLFLKGMDMEVAVPDNGNEAIIDQITIIMGQE